MRSRLHSAFRAYFLRLLAVRFRPCAQPPLHPNILHRTCRFGSKLGPPPSATFPTWSKLTSKLIKNLFLQRRTRLDALSGPGGVPVVVQRTRRKKTVGIIVENGGVRIRAPMRLANWRIQELLDSRVQWISDKLRVQAEAEATPPHLYEAGEVFVYLGAPYRLAIADIANGLIRIDKEHLVAPRATEQARRIEDWFLAQAVAVLSEVTNSFAARLEVEPRSIKVRQYRSQWGSCSSRGDIRYNARLIHAPLDVVEYVVVHELAHLIHLNHSPQFWKVVGDLIPDHRDHRKWLRRHGSTLQV